MDYHYKLYDDDIVAYKFVRDIILDPNNIKEHYRVDDDTDYKYILFNHGDECCGKFYKDYKRMISNCEFDYNYIMYRIITPAVLEYADEYNMLRDVVDWIKEHNDTNTMCIYALSIAEDIIDDYKDYINDILNDTTARTIAINKIKRNKIVNGGILLNLSMRDCGMF